MVEELIEYFDESRKAASNSPCAILVTIDGEVVLERYAAGAYEDLPLGPVDEGALWPLFSVTKSFAMTLVLALAEDGILKLDDPVSRYLPAFATHGEGEYDRRKVTIRHLTAFTSGVAIPPEKYVPRKHGPPPDVELVQIDTEPGSVFLYHALSGHLLEGVVEAAAGQDCLALMQARVFDPLGLVDTRYLFSFDPDLPRVPPSPEIPADPGTDDGLALKGLLCWTGLSATARDVNRLGQFWVRAGEFKNQKLFSEQLRDEAWKRQKAMEHYGLLWGRSMTREAYIMAGSHRMTTVVVPESRVVLTVMRILLPGAVWPEGEKELLADLAFRLGE